VRPSREYLLDTSERSSCPPCALVRSKQFTITIENGKYRHQQTKRRNDGNDGLADANSGKCQYCRDAKQGVFEFFVAKEKNSDKVPPWLELRPAPPAECLIAVRSLCGVSDLS
jgi:hypothetical protein